MSSFERGEGHEAHSAAVSVWRGGCHGGSGGVFFWIDPVRDLVAVFFSTYLSMTKDERPVAATDLFLNALLASIVDD